MLCIAAASMLAAMPGLAQDQRVGVSRPDPSPIVADSPDDASSPAKPPAKPSADVLAAAPAVVYGPYIPYHAPPAVSNPDADIVGEAPAGQGGRRPLPAKEASKANLDAGIVTYVPSRPGEVPEGTLVKVKLREPLSTQTTRPGTQFTAEVSEPVMRDGKVIVPVGALLEGRVTWVRGGRRVGGRAAIHIEPRTITLPDGAQYLLHARVIDTDSWKNTKVDSEGTMTRQDVGKGTVATMALTTGGGMAAGAMIAGVPGALIGAGVGAGASTVIWLKQDRQAVLPKNLGIVFSLAEPMRATPLSATARPMELGSRDGE
jgi:hypothetical protein